MDKMKTAEKLFNKNSRPIPTPYDAKLFVLTMVDFKEALAEHHKEIENIIDEIDLEYYETVTSTQDHPDVLRAELNDLIKEITELKERIGKK